MKRRHLIPIGPITIQSLQWMDGPNPACSKCNIQRVTVMVVNLIIYAEHILPLSFIKIAPESCLTDFIGVIKLLHNEHYLIWIHQEIFH